MIKTIHILDLDIEIGIPVTVDGQEVPPKDLMPLANWPSYDPDPRSCDGHGHATCLKDGRHSWFNHTMDSHYANPNLNNLPDGYKEQE